MQTKSNVKFCRFPITQCEKEHCYAWNRRNKSTEMSLKFGKWKIPNWIQIRVFYFVLNSFFHHETFYVFIWKSRKLIMKYLFDLILKEKPNILCAFISKTSMISNVNQNLCIQYNLTFTHFVEQIVNKQPLEGFYRCSHETAPVHQQKTLWITLNIWGV